MAAIKKIKQKSMRDEKKPRTTPLLLPRNEREAKKLAEMNAILEKTIFLPEKTDSFPEKNETDKRQIY